MDPIRGLHHVTVVARDPQRNADFYRNVLGQRLVKRTVNYDDPGTYHFYFADQVGTPGSVLTFFPWINVKRGARGNGETAAVAYNVPDISLGFWMDHLKRSGVALEPVEQRFGVDVLPFDDPDGLRIELVASGASPAIRHWEEGAIPQVYALSGFNSVTLWLDEIGPTADLLTNHMGYTLTGQKGERYRFTGGKGELAGTLDILHRPGEPEAVFGAGSVHHIAFRVPDDASQLEYRAALQQAGYGVTPVRDRSYFHSIYYREPGGVLFEIATNAPGFATDEPVEELGEELKLPAWLESRRIEIENILEPLVLGPVEKAV